MKNLATCHPEKFAYGNGLCSTCWQREWKKKNPGKNALYSRRYHQKYPERVRARSQQWQQANKATQIPKQVANNRLRRYGVSAEEYRARFAEQKGLCALCQCPQPFSQLAVDHCHETGKIRKLLCRSCNTGIGGLKDSIPLLKAAIRYLEEHRNE